MSSDMDSKLEHEAHAKQTDNFQDNDNVITTEALAPANSEAASHLPVHQSQWQSFDQVPLEPVSPNHYAQVNIESLIFSCLLLVVASLIIILPGDFYLTRILAVSIGALIIISLVSYVRYQHAKSLAYAVCDHELIMQKGFWWQKRTSLPYSRLQHVSLSHGPLERHFNLASIKCFSAGSGSAEIELPGIEQDTAEHLRQHLLAQAAKANPAAITTTATTAALKPDKDEEFVSEALTTKAAATEQSETDNHTSNPLEAKEGLSEEKPFKHSTALQQGRNDDA
ncbi:PH domain-containing protein [Shewanella sp. 10N.261.52.F9]|uniref:PH domain-containing protein n=1 Tax=Shewanella sp. 10N.261.52.F9 TaxID=3229684 RepID=UPI00354FA2D2